MKKTLASTAAAIGLLASAPLQAQTTTSGSTSGQTTSSQGIPIDGTGSTTSTFRDGRAMIGATLSTTGGRYGTIADVIYDGTGSARFALVERQGQLHPVPFSLLQFGATGDANVSLSSATLDTVTVDRNNLQSMSTQSFITQLSTAYGPSIARMFAGTGNGNANSNSTAGQRSQLYSLSSLFGGSINAQGGAAGTISNVAIAPNGQIAYAVGTSSTGDSRFAVPFSLASLSSGGTGLSVNLTSQALAGLTIPQGSLPTFTDPAFRNEILTAFGSGANGFLNSFNSSSTTNLGNGNNRVDPFYSDPVVRAGDASQSGANAVANAGDARRGGANAVARAGDRASANGNAAAMNSTGSTGTANTGTTPGTTGTTAGGIVNIAPDVAPTQSSLGSNGLIQMRDLLNFRIQASDGAFGRVSDIVFDRNGNVQYLLGTHNGETFPLPFMPSAFSGSGNTLSYNVPSSTLQQLGINPQNLPSMNNQQFVSRMQQVFGSSFGANSSTSTSGYGTTLGTTGSTAGSSTGVTGTSTGTTASPQGTIGTTGLPHGRTTSTGTGTTTGTGTGAGTTFPGPAADNSTGPKRPEGVSAPSNPFTKSRTGAGSTTSTAGGTASGTTSQDTWTWPSESANGTTNNATGPKLPAGSLPPSNPFTKSRTGAGSGVRSNSGNTNNSGVGTGGRLQNPPPNGRANGRTGNNTGASGGTSGSGTTGGSGTSGGSTSGSGTTGGTSGGTSGSGSTGGSTGSGS